MNQLMLELYQQALEFAYKNISKESWNTDNFHAVVSGKFAELIVRECAKFLEENSGYDNSNNAWHPEPEDLLKHFGVEE